MQLVDLIETYGYETRKDLVSKKEENKRWNVIKRCKKWSFLMILYK